MDHEKPTELTPLSFMDSINKTSEETKYSDTALENQNLSDLVVTMQKSKSHNVQEESKQKVPETQNTTNSSQLWFKEIQK